MTSPHLSNLISRKTQLVLDVLVMAAAFTVAYLLRFDFMLPASVLHNWPLQTAFVVLLQVLLIRLVGAHDISWRTFSLYDLPAFTIPMAVAAVPLVIFRVYLPAASSMFRIPLSVIFMNFWFGLSFLVGIRLLRRVTAEAYGNGDNSSGKRRNVLLAGAGAAGTLALRELRQNSSARLNVIGFVDDDPQKQNLTVQGTRVLGTTNDIPALAEKHRISEVIITIARASRESIAGIAGICKSANIPARIIPSFSEIMEGRRQIAALRSVDIEDVLGREPVDLDDADVRDFVQGKVVMITGAGGSIGSELVRQIAHYRPAYMVLVERNELAMYKLDQELCSIIGIPPWRAVVADAGNIQRMRSLLDEHAVQIIIHAAAYKHVPLMEDNSVEALRNNTITTYELGKLAAEKNIATFLLVSTDKAVNPTSVMGAAKRAAELCIQHLAANNSGTRYVAVRFGNVLGSSGSVIPLFRQQIADGGPVTVTSPEMTRYFMTIPEAVSLVLKSATLGENGQIMVLDMGEPMKIIDLARKMIELSGLTPGEDIRIEYTGLRPGEKMYEELSTDTENAQPTTHPKIFVGKIQDVAGIPVPQFIKECTDIGSSAGKEQICSLLLRMVPEAKFS